MIAVTPPRICGPQVAVASLLGNVERRARHRGWRQSNATYCVWFVSNNAKATVSKFWHTGPFHSTEINSKLLPSQRPDRLLTD